MVEDIKWVSIIPTFHILKWMLKIDFIAHDINGILPSKDNKQKWKNTIELFYGIMLTEKIVDNVGRTE